MRKATLLPAIGLLLLLAITSVACNNNSTNRHQARMYLPAEGFNASVAQGDSLFHEKCAKCHGQSATGTIVGPPLIHNVYAPNHHADQSFRFAVRDGVTQHHWRFGNMPAQPNTSPEDIGHIIAYIRKKQSDAGIF